jgi:nitrogen fixation protein NifQ
MNAADVYRWLMQAPTRSVCDGFDAHVVASALGLGFAEAAAGESSLADALGLGGPSLLQMVEETFPHARAALERFGSLAEPEAAEDEACLRELLGRHATSGSAFELRLAAIVARRALRPNHLWQDLGLRHRRELSWLMSRHFEALAAKNTADMKWKKFLYRAICRDEGFGLCPAPSCGECADRDGCFGEEHGDALLAARRV